MESSQYCSACHRVSEKCPSEKYCIDCEESLCEKCIIAHTKNKMTLSHSFIDISLVSSLPALLANSARECDQHPDFKLDLVCCTHDIVLCRSCMLQDHRLCDVVLPIETASKRTKENCESGRLASESDKIHQSITKVIEFGQNNAKNVQLEEKKIIKAIATVRSKFMLALKSVEQELEKNVSQSYATRVENIEIYKNDITKLREIALVYRQEIDFIRRHASENKAFLLLERLKHDIHRDQIKMKNVAGKIKHVELLYADTSDFEVKSVGQIVVKNGPCPVKYTPSNEILSSTFKYTGERQLETKVELRHDEDSFEEECLYEELDQVTRKIDNSNEPFYVTSVGPHLTVSPREVELVQTIHTGKFTEIWTGILRKNDKVAIKRIKPEKQDTRLQVLTETLHENILKFYGVFVDKSIQSLVFEYMSHLDLIRYLRTKEGQKLHETELLSMASQIARGMAYLENKRIIHAKFQGKRMLVGENREVKISGVEYRTVEKVETLYDYIPTNEDELSFKSREYITVIDQEDENWWEGELNGHRGVFPKNYTSEPKQYIEQDKSMYKWYSLETLETGCCDIKSNVWSFGIVLIEILTRGKKPYSDLNDTELHERLKYGYRHPKPQECSDEVYKVVASCWNACPESRPTFEFMYNFIEDLIYDC